MGKQTAKLINTFVFATGIVKFIYFLNPKFPASNHLLLLHNPVCVGPGRNPYCSFSHAQAHLPSRGSPVLSVWMSNGGKLRAREVAGSLHL